MRQNVHRFFLSERRCGSKISLRKKRESKTNRTCIVHQSEVKEVWTQTAEDQCLRSLMHTRTMSWHLPDTLYDLKEYSMS